MKISTVVSILYACYSRLKHINVCLYLDIDCCKGNIIGDEDLYGIYNINASLINKSSVQKCLYGIGTITTSQVQQECVGSLSDGPKWKKPNFSNCSTQYKTTSELLELSKVGKCIYISYKLVSFEILVLYTFIIQDRRNKLESEVAEKFLQGKKWK